jgi:hypothetical protein
LDLKENVIVGHLIPAGTGVRNFQKVLVGSGNMSMPPMNFGTPTTQA